MSQVNTDLSQQSANVGDSRAVASVRGRVDVLSNDHKPGNEGETRRIIAAGGWVEFNRGGLTAGLVPSSKQRPSPSSLFITRLSLAIANDSLSFLIDRCFTIVTDKEDQKRELYHIRGALKVCGYPQLTINKVVKDTETKISGKQEGKGFRKKERDKTKNKSKRMKAQHKCSNDKALMEESPCKNCETVYIGETGRKLGTRINEHKKDAHKFSHGQEGENRKQQNTPVQHNHVIDWEGERQLSSDFEFIVLACDGIWDVLTNQEVVDFVRARLAQRMEPETVC
ncbi:hypothetical protein DPMN_108606 [Dreissena polymorpha]|uniref:protein-serine/threonine phosphatase n=1 Tax=Dreissena polymorpha TaxID=45954 RepID=A0A9D4QL65_DREPO|nr:hypothetical protein DPMN_108606 [Dreissena polymorpha]